MLVGVAPLVAAAAARLVAPPTPCTIEEIHEGGSTSLAEDVAADAEQLLAACDTLLSQVQRHPADIVLVRLLETGGGKALAFNDQVITLQLNIRSAGALTRPAGCSETRHDRVIGHHQLLQRSSTHKLNTIPSYPRQGATAG
jgi:hypothetical protein